MKYFIVLLVLVGSLYAEVKKEFYENKQLKSETSYKDGVKHGLEKKYYDDGQIYRSTSYKDGVKHGIDKDYYSYKGRTVITEYQYKNGRVLPGKKTFEKYDNKVRYLWKEIFYIDGKKIEEEYYKNGNIEAIIHFKDEKIKDTEERYYENGNLKRKIVYVGKKGDGYFQDILSEKVYANIKKVGLRGKRNALLHYKEAKRIAKSKEYYTDENQKLISESYEKACDLNHAESCTLLATILDRHRVFGYMKKSYKTSLHKKACDLGSGKGCFWLAWSYYHVGYDEVKDMPNTIKYYKKSCDLGFNSGCSNLAWTYLEGKEVTRDAFKANKYYKKSCDLGHDSSSCDMAKKLTDKGYN
ncbi:MAG: hypothetical protein GQ531_01515 [Sulfurovum sp.]|nr:hypothetical protein [Sulfurovum sp.]